MAPSLSQEGANGNDNKIEPSCTKSLNSHERKKPLNPQLLEKHIQWYEERKEKGDSRRILTKEQLPIHLQYLAEFILTEQHPLSVDELDAFLMNFPMEQLILHHNISSMSSLTLEEQAQCDRDLLLKALTPNLVEINTCSHCDETLYIPVKKGSVYVLAGAARYQYRHAIKKLSKTEQKEHLNYRRVSLTLRSLLPGRRQVAIDSNYDNDISQYDYASSPQTKP